MLGAFKWQSSTSYKLIFFQYSFLSFFSSYWATPSNFSSLVCPIPSDAISALKLSNDPLCGLLTLLQFGILHFMSSSLVFTIFIFEMLITNEPNFETTVISFSI